MLQLHPDKTLSELSYSTGAIHLFDDTKAEVETRAKRDAELKRIAEAREKLEAYRKSLVVYETRPYYVNFVPFGAGQFQNGDRGSGVFFAVSEGLTGGVLGGHLRSTSSTTYGFVATGPDRRGHRASASSSRSRSGRGIAFLGLYAWGVVDSLFHYTAAPADRRATTRSLPPRPARCRQAETHAEDLASRSDPPRPDDRRPPASGIGIGWEN